MADAFNDVKVFVCFAALVGMTYLGCSWLESAALSDRTELQTYGWTEVSGPLMIKGPSMTSSTWHRPEGDLHAASGGG